MFGYDPLGLVVGTRVPASQLKSGTVSPIASSHLAAYSIKVSDRRPRGQSSSITAVWLTPTSSRGMSSELVEQAAHRLPLAKTTDATTLSDDNGSDLRIVPSLPAAPGCNASAAAVAA